jgi:hypothetical protein
VFQKHWSRGPDNRVSIRGWGKKNFFSPPCADYLWGQPILLSNGYRWSFRRGQKQSGRDSNHSPPLMLIMCYSGIVYLYLKNEINFRSSLVASFHWRCWTLRFCSSSLLTNKHNVWAQIAKRFTNCMCEVWVKLTNKCNGTTKVLQFQMYVYKALGLSCTKLCIHRKRRHYLKILGEVGKAWPVKHL